jgi:hypothetical protein
MVFGGRNVGKRYTRATAAERALAGKRLTRQDLETLGRKMAARRVIDYPGSS